MNARWLFVFQLLSMSPDELAEMWSRRDAVDRVSVVMEELVEWNALRYADVAALESVLWAELMGSASASVALIVSSRNAAAVEGFLLSESAGRCDLLAAELVDAEVLERGVVVSEYSLVETQSNYGFQTDRVLLLTKEIDCRLAALGDEETEERRAYFVEWLAGSVLKGMSFAGETEAVSRRTLFANQEAEFEAIAASCRLSHDTAITLTREREIMASMGEVVAGEVVARRLVETEEIFAEEDVRRLMLVSEECRALAATWTSMEGEGKAIVSRHRAVQLSTLMEAEALERAAVESEWLRGGVPLFLQALDDAEMVARRCMEDDLEKEMQQVFESFDSSRSALLATVLRRKEQEDFAQFSADESVERSAIEVHEIQEVELMHRSALVEEEACVLELEKAAWTEAASATAAAEREAAAASLEAEETAERSAIASESARCGECVALLHQEDTARLQILSAWSHSQRDIVTKELVHREELSRELLLRAEKEDAAAAVAGSQSTIDAVAAEELLNTQVLLIQRAVRGGLVRRRLRKRCMNRRLQQQRDRLTAFHIEEFELRQLLLRDEEERRIMLSEYCSASVPQARPEETPAERAVREFTEKETAARRKIEERYHVKLAKLRNAERKQHLNILSLALAQRDSLLPAGVTNADRNGGRTTEPYGAFDSTPLIPILGDDDLLRPAEARNQYRGYELDPIGRFLLDYERELRKLRDNISHHRQAAAVEHDRLKDIRDAAAQQVARVVPREVIVSARPKPLSDLVRGPNVS